jgi:hypothetical protein
MLKIAAHLLLIFFLTILTQIGGLLYAGLWGITKWYKLRRLAAAFTCVLVYLLATFLVVPYLAPKLGRVPLPLNGNLAPLTYLTVFLNRHYVKPDLRDQLQKAADAVNKRYPETTTYYLDANFPFVNGFPLLPHWSHNDGKKVDLAFFYKDENNKAVSGSPSPLGYGVYDSPTSEEINYPDICTKKGFFQYGALAWLVPAWSTKNWQTDKERTAFLIKLLTEDRRTSKLFIEPHLKQRWGLEQNEKIRFHGCHAVRHDDHIHTQIR